MHPFTLTEEQVQEVSGGSGRPSLGGAIVSNLMLEGGQIDPIYPPKDDPILTTMAIGEEGGEPPAPLD